MNGIRWTGAALCALLLAGAGRGAEPASDPFLGKWLLDPGASKYSDGRCPKRMVIEMTMEARGIRYHSETEPATGEVFHVDYVARYDGKPAVVTGDRGILLPVTLQRISANNVRASYSSGFQLMATSDRMVSADRNTMTITTVSHDAGGRNQTNVGVYRRAGS